MKFKLTKASDWCWEDEIEINTLEELIKFIKKNWAIIMDEPLDKKRDKRYRIIIYDYYVE